MTRILRNKKGQNTAEYALLLGLVVAAAIAMQTYVKRGIQARVHDEVIDMATKTSSANPDLIAAGVDGLGTTQQYEPDYLASTSTTTTNTDTKTKTGAASSPTIGVDVDVSTPTASQTLKAPAN